MEPIDVINIRNTIHYSNVNTETGEWKVVSSDEHHGTAVPRVLRKLTERTNAVMGQLVETIKNQFEEPEKIKSFIYKLLNEIRMHIIEIAQLKGRAFSQINLEKMVSNQKLVTSRMALDVVGNQDKMSKLPAFRKPSQNFSRTEHLNNEMVYERLNETIKYLESLMSTVDSVDLCWKKIKGRPIKENFDVIEKNQWGNKISEACLQMLDIAPGPNPDLSLCYRKIGELHANIALKRHELECLEYIKKYLPIPLNDKVQICMGNLMIVHAKFVDAHGDLPVRATNMDLRIEDRNIKELEMLSRGLEELLKKREPGKEFLALNASLRKLRSLIAEKYQIFIHKNLEHCREVIGSDDFQNMIESCKELMLALGQELVSKTVKEIDHLDLQHAGAALGTTTQIDSYEKVVNAALSALNNFMTNTLHMLVRGMLRNTPETSPEGWGLLNRAYQTDEKALSELDNADLRR